MSLTPRQLHRLAATAHRELGESWEEAQALDGLAAARLDDDPAAALRHWTRALRLLDGYDDPRAAAARERVERGLAQAEAPPG
ncbi:hypothetical protein [Streptomyces sp. NBC_01429]|uniref:hypothetical protein n=1 Tax=Streptomyces sp. NBC_01429 TaxID=2903862 RepID=UPI002E29E661|nr:hypothetical protein [Streptomyces sp. NBC_01429]